MKIKLQSKIIVGNIIILGLSSIITMYLSINMLLINTDESIERNLLHVGEIVSHLPAVIEGLEESPDAGWIQGEIMTMLEETSDIDYIVVCNMEGIRYSHPNQELLGLPLVGGDDKQIRVSPESYISTAEGTLGLAIRAFVPVFAYDQKTQIGYVAVGTLRTSIRNAQRQLILSYVIYLFSGLIIGVIGAFVLARNIKKSLLGLEPDDLAKLYRENKGMMGALHEGVLAIDKNGKITLLNDSAKELLDLDDNSLGKDVETVLKNSRLLVVAKTGKAEYDQEQTVSGRVIITNRVPLMERGKSIGAIATFRDRTMVIQLAEQLTGVNQLVDSLRASTHEFMNKLHTILGLLELSEYESAKEFILEIQKKQQDLNKRLFNDFKDPVIAGLILGKVSASKEQGVRMQVSPESHIGTIEDRDFSNTLVTIIGNLIDNAIESARNCPDREGCVELLISQEEQEVYLEVRDNGTGISREHMELMFHRGFSTKETGRGMGLFLIKQEIEKRNGRIDVLSNEQSTVFSVYIKWGTEDDKSDGC